MADAPGGKQPGLIARRGSEVRGGAAARWSAVYRWSIDTANPRRRRRALILLAVVFGTLTMIRFAEIVSGFAVVRAGLEWFADGAFFHPLLFPEKAPEWRDRIQAVLVLLGLPVAFLLWHWRDCNMRAQIESQRKDINLKEFEEVQLRASGALDPKLPKEARQQLQIAALHQLRGFLRGAYGEDFRRPAFELLLAGHTAARDRIGHLKALNDYYATKPPAGERAKEIAEIIERGRAKLTPVDHQRMGIIRDEAGFIVGDRAKDREGRWFPLNGRRFDWIDFSGLAARASRDLTECSFIGAKLAGAHLEGAVLGWAHLEGAHLENAHLKGAKLDWAHLEGTHFAGAHLEGAKLDWAHLEDARLEGAHLEGVRLMAARLEGARLEDAHLEGAKLWRAHFESAHLEGARLEGADFQGAHLEGRVLKAHFMMQKRRSHMVGRRCPRRSGKRYGGSLSTSACEATLRRAAQTHFEARRRAFSAPDTATLETWRSPRRTRRSPASGSGSRRPCCGCSRRLRNRSPCARRRLGGG